jgi:hypothetical protein
MHFVVLHHTGWPGHPDHYDLMLQSEAGRDDDDPVLKTFSTHADEFPDPSGGGIRLVLIAPHRRAYLHYQGPLSDQRGRVERVDEGEMNPLCTSPLAEGRDAEAALQIELRGRRLWGKYRLRRVNAEEYAFEKSF